MFIYISIFRRWYDVLPDPCGSVRLWISIFHIRFHCGIQIHSISQLDSTLSRSANNNIKLFIRESNHHHWEWAAVQQILFILQNFTYRRGEGFDSRFFFNMLMMFSWVKLLKSVWKKLISKIAQHSIPAPPTTQHCLFMLVYSLKFHSPFM